MKKNLLINLLLVCTPFVFYSCGSDDDDNKMNVSPGTETESKLPDTTPANVVAVDLGLPSGTKWANMNIGAESPEDYGLYFAWGETIGYKPYSHTFDYINYKWYNWVTDYTFTIKKYSTKSSYEFVDNKTELEPEDDAATVNWGAPWCIPSEEQIHELIKYTTSEWTIQEETVGRKFTASNGNYIFFPATGEMIAERFELGGVNAEYWSSYLNDINPATACVLIINSFSGSCSHRETDSGAGRYQGHPIRPVIINK